MGVALLGTSPHARLLDLPPPTTCHPPARPQMSGRVVWTGASSLDIRMELVQAGQLQLSALFTFVARDPLSGKACRINPVQPQTQQARGGWGGGGARTERPARLRARQA